MQRTLNPSDRTVRPQRRSTAPLKALSVVAAAAVCLTGLAVVGSPASADPYGAGGPVLVSRPHSVLTQPAGASGLGDTMDMEDGGNAVVFVSAAKTLVPGVDTNNKNDVYWKQFSTGLVELVSLGVGGVQPNMPSSSPSMSDDGRYVAFVTAAANLGIASDTNAAPDVFVRDRETSATTRVSLGQTAAGGGSQPSVSGTGRYVAFVDNGNVYRRDRNTSTTIEVSLGLGGLSANGPCDHPSVSDDGKKVAFTCAGSANNLVSGDSNAKSDVFVRDLTAGVTTRASVATAGTQLPAGGTGGVISGDGNVIGFVSASPAITGGSALGTELYLRRTVSSTTVLGSPADNTTTQGGGAASVVSAFELADDGATTVFTASGGARQPFPTTAETDVYVARLGANACTVLVSNNNYQGGNGASRTPVISFGTYAVAFASSASDLVTSDTNGVEDIFTNDTYCPPRPKFSDVPLPHPFFTEIEWMVSGGVADGYPGGLFKPTAPVSRQAVASFLWKLNGSPAPKGPAPTFDDVGADHPFRTAIWWMVGEGLTSGYADGGFHPSAVVTRQALASFLWKLSDSPVVQTPTPFVTDVDAAHPFFKAIAWMVKEKIAKGYADGTFAPTGAVSRQAAAAFLERWEEEVEGPKK